MVKICELARSRIEQDVKLQVHQLQLVMERPGWAGRRVHLRLEEIDGEAARTQARVEELERAYIERLEAERDAPLPGEESEALPEIQVTDPEAIAEPPRPQ